MFPSQDEVTINISAVQYKGQKTSLQQECKMHTVCNSSHHGGGGAWSRGAWSQVGVCLVLGGVPGPGGYLVPGAAWSGEGVVCGPGLWYSSMH